MKQLHLAHLDLVDRLLLTAIGWRDSLGQQPAQPARHGGRVVDAPLLHPLAQHEEEDDGRRLEEVGEHERAHHRQRHCEEHVDRAVVHEPSKGTHDEQQIITTASPHPHQELREQDYRR